MGQSGRPHDLSRRKALALAVLREAAFEELKVANGRTPRGNTSMAQSMSTLHKRVAAEAGVSLRWVEEAWAKCRADAVEKAAREITKRLEDADKLAEEAREGGIVGANLDKTQLSGKWRAVRPPLPKRMKHRSK